jgi:hypothetical protein
MQQEDISLLKAMAVRRAKWKKGKQKISKNKRKRE